MNIAPESIAELEVEIPCGEVVLPGILRRPREAEGLVIFAHGAGSNRHSCRNERIAREFNRRNLATLLFDLLSPWDAGSQGEEAPRLDLRLLADRLACATDWAAAEPQTRELQMGLLGAGTGAAATLSVAARFPRIHAVVTRGGRTDLAGDCVTRVKAPTLLIAGAEDHAIVGWNYATYERLTCLKCLMLVGGATHLFTEPGALDQVADLAADWFHKHLSKNTPAVQPSNPAI
jgi:putative phosphoribosyl transferase